MNEEPLPEEKAARDVRILRRLWRYVRPHRLILLLATLALFGASAVVLAYPRLASMAIDQLSGDGLQLADLGWLLGLALLLQTSLVWVRHFTMSYLGERVVCDLRIAVAEHILTLPLQWFHERRTGELVSRLTADVTIVENVVGSELSMALRNGVQLIGSVVLLFLISTKLTLAMLAIVPPVIIVTMTFGKFIWKRSKEAQDQLADVAGHVQEAFGAIATVQAFAREGKAAADYRRGIEASFARMMSLFRWRASFFAAATLVVYIAVAVIIGLGAHAKQTGELTAGELTEFFLYTFLIAGAVAEIAGLWGSLQRAAGATDRLFAILDTVPSIRSPRTPLPLPHGPGAVTFQGVSFVYPARPDVPVLTNVSLAIAPGTTLAIVGASGAGKSTMLQLLYRFFDPTAGDVTLDGANVRNLDLAELRRALAMVAQEPVLFSGTIAENIAYAKDHATQEDIERAAKDANAHNFIMSFPDGYQTVIGERGTKLSGGQKQRIAIARAVLANPRVLVLDEATSNLDAESEAAVQESLLRLMQGRTTIIVAHRLSTVRDAHRIVVMERGQLIESGTHDELMIARGAYARLVERQLLDSSTAAP